MAEPLAETENKFRTFYHGTYPDRIDSILRTGLDPSYVGGGGGTLPGLNEKDPRPKLFLTTSPSYAEFYANMAAKTSAMAKAKEEGKGWIRQMLAQGTPAPPLRIDLPSDFKVHELAKGLGGHDEHYVTDLIPSRYIKAMNRLEKAAAFGAMMGKGAAEMGPGSFKTNEEMMHKYRNSDAGAGSLVRPPGSNFETPGLVERTKGSDLPTWLTNFKPFGIGAKPVVPNVKANVPVPNSQRSNVSVAPGIHNPLRSKAPPSTQLQAGELAQQKIMKDTGAFGGPGDINRQ